MVPTLGSQVEVQQRKDVDQKRRGKGFTRLFHQLAKHLLPGVHVLGREDET